MSDQNPFEQPAERPADKPSDAPRVEIIPAPRPGTASGPLAELAEIARMAPRRDESMVLLNLSRSAARAGESYFYRFPVKLKDGRTEHIEGPSIKCANDVVRYFGKVWVGARVVSETDDAWYMEGLLVDLETGAMYARPHRQRKSQKVGGRWDDDRQMDIAFQIGASKAIRTVVTNALGQFTDYAFEQARSGLLKRVGDNPNKARAWLKAKIAELGIDVRRVERTVGRTIDKWLVPDMARVYAELSAINDEFADADSLYPEETATEPGPALEKPKADAKAKEPAKAKKKTAAKPAAAKKDKAAEKAADKPPPEEAAAEPQPDPDDNPDLGRGSGSFEFVE